MEHLAWLYMTGALPDGEVNHVNKQKDDNRWCNLRLSTHLQNSWSRKKYTTNTSGFKGVSWSQRNHKWVAQITVSYKNIYLGLFTKKEDAARAYNAAAIKYFAQFAVVNEIPSYGT
jgi:hypothetical protein